MKKFLALLGVLLISGCGNTIAPVEENVEEEDYEDKTIGEQIEEAKEGLEDCEKNCNQALTTEIKEQCLLGCKMAKGYTDQLEEMTKGMQDKTSKELEEEMKKMYGI